LEGIKEMQEFFCETGQGQDKRVAARFALIGLAGELATEYGLTGWPAGEALQSVAIGLQAWRSMRGGRDNDERHQIQNRILEFIEKHGDSRFSDVAGGNMSQIRDRAGWWEDKSGERLYHFTSAGLREAVKEFDFKRGLDVLEELGVLPPSGSSGERAVPKRFSGRLVRVYSIAANKLARVEAGAEPALEGVAPNVTLKNRKIKGDTSVTLVTAEVETKPKKYERRK
jgi:putative DNA primase/helicase